MTRRFHQTTLADELSLGEVNEPELLAAMDWLPERQERVENTLARRHLERRRVRALRLVLQLCGGPLLPAGGARAQPRRQAGQAAGQLGACVLARGRPVAVQVHPGNTADPTTVPGVIDTVKERFGIERVILVGDRAMITDAHAHTLKELGAGFVSALKSAQIRKLMKAGDLQLSLFDQTNLAEITSTEFPVERLVVCRNPHLAAERARKREDLLAATERELEKVTASVTNPRGRLHAAPTPARSGSASGASSTSTRSPNTSSWRSTDGSFSLRAQDRADHRGGRARRALRAPHHLPRPISSPPKPSCASTNS